MHSSVPTVLWCAIHGCTGLKWQHGLHTYSITHPTSPCPPLILLPSIVTDQQGSEGEESLWLLYASASPASITGSCCPQSPRQYCSQIEILKLGLLRCSLLLRTGASATHSRRNLANESSRTCRMLPRQAMLCLPPRLPPARVTLVIIHRLHLGSCTADSRASRLHTQKLNVSC